MIAFYRLHIAGPLVAGLIIVVAPAHSEECAPDRSSQSAPNFPMLNSTMAADIVHTRIAGRNFFIPRNFFRHPPIGCGEEQPAMLLQVLLPNLLPYSRATAAEFGGAGWGRKMNILVRQEKSNFATFSKLVANRVRDQGTQPIFDSDLGLFRKEARPQGFVYYDVEGEKPNIVIDCDWMVRAPSYTGPLHPSCRHLFYVGDELRFEATYSQNFLTHWRQTETSIKVLFEKFGTAPN